MVSEYSIHFSSKYSKTSSKAVPDVVNLSAPASVRNVRTGSLAVKGVKIFNLLPPQLRNSDHGDILMFLNDLDIFLSDIPDESTVQGLTRAALSNRLLAQIPLLVGSRMIYPAQP